MNVENFESISLAVLISALICFMGFIVWDLSRRSKAGKLGTTVLFITLGMGCAGFIIKTVLMEVIKV